MHSNFLTLARKQKKNVALNTFLLLLLSCTSAPCLHLVDTFYLPEAVTGYFFRVLPVLQLKDEKTNPSAAVLALYEWIMMCDVEIQGVERTDGVGLLDSDSTGCLHFPCEG